MDLASIVYSALSLFAGTLAVVISSSYIAYKIRNSYFGYKIRTIYLRLKLRKGKTSSL